MILFPKVLNIDRKKMIYKYLITFLHFFLFSIRYVSNLIKFSFTEVLSRISEKQKRAQSIEEMERELENINLKLRDEYTGISIARAEAAGEFEKFEAEKLQLKFRRDALRDMIKTEKGRK